MSEKYGINLVLEVYCANNSRTPETEEIKTLISDPFFVMDSPQISYSCESLHNMPEPSADEVSRFCLEHIINKC